MFIIELNTFAAYLGAFTGTTSFVITIYNFYTSRPKYKLSFPCKATFLNFSNPLKVTDLFKESGRIFIFTRIENQSSMPVTITEYNLKLPNSNEEIFSNSTSKATEKYYLENDQAERFIDIGNNQLLPPLKIEPYGAVEGFILFPILEIISNEIIRAELTVCTTRTKIKSVVLLHPSPNNVKNKNVSTLKIDNINQ